ncbi:hypothetical protein HYC85_001419 [Camellia sinensis]|uniref:RING-type E3 ubiquitin transferase n=1 Tax=Camellia sinensis TaxID=4442 RepID=A0A7J7I5E2_CAMSI|nr:hypothetical protein HYC85_001419 [Camellia sinensis]
MVVSTTMKKTSSTYTWLPLSITIFFSATSVSSSLSYSDHCSSLVPESTPTVVDNPMFPLFRILRSHYTGGDGIVGNFSYRFSQNQVFFQPSQHIFKTNTTGVYKIGAYLIFRHSSAYIYHPPNSTHGRSHYPQNSHRTGPLKFSLDGFWSQSSGKLCMVGSASWYSAEGKILNLDAVLSFAMNSTIFPSLVTGKLDSLSSPTDLNYFEPISIVAFVSSFKYNYKLVPKEVDRGCPGGNDIPQNQSLGFQRRKFCSMLQRGMNTFKLEYTNECVSWKNCTPLGQGIEYLPLVMSLSTIQCSEYEHKVQYSVGFGNNSDNGYIRAFDPTTLLVAEGSWDGNKNRLCMVACRILHSTPSLASPHVGDCSIRLSFRYPAVWSIRDRSSIVGQIWTNKTANEPGYFNKITFGTYDNRNGGVSGSLGLRYEYTETDRVRKSCLAKMQPAKKNWTGDRYPKGNSYDMSFDTSVKDSMGKIAWGYAVPIFVGNESYGQYHYVLVSNSTHKKPEVEENKSFSGPLNISYEISIMRLHSPIPGISSSNLSFISKGRVEIFAEGVYDDETGKLCMVGCRKVSPNDSMDCELLLKFQFPPVNAKRGGIIKGSIESTRKKTDPLFFEYLTLSSIAFYTGEANKAVRRMDLEIIMVLISNTLACVLVGLQLFHVKRNPDVLPLISIVMVVILTLGHMIPLVLNYEAMFFGIRNRQNVFRGNDGWVEVNEVIVRVVTMVAFLLQFRLLQLVWTARLGDENRKSLWIAEKKTLFVSLPLYIVGLLIAWLMNLGKNNQSIVMGSSLHQQHSLWGALRSYGGLILDGFLFPQILLNAFRFSKESALSHSFYIGTTFVRLLPHAYDLYRAQNYARPHLHGSYFYANPSADFYSTSWDVIIPCGGVLFAAIIFFQQRFGGRFILPRRFREAEGYEKVPVVSSSE